MKKLLMAFAGMVWRFVGQYRELDFVIPYGFMNINVEIINKKNGLYRAEGKGNYTARVLRGILSPVTI